MEASLLVTDGGLRLTWHPKCFVSGGSRGSLGVVGRLVGGCILMLGIGGGEGEAERRPRVEGDRSCSVCVEEVTMIGSSFSGGGVSGGLGGSSTVCEAADTIFRGKIMSV